MATQRSDEVVLNYFATVDQLSVKAQGQGTTQQAQTAQKMPEWLGPILPFSPYLISGVLFLSVFSVVMVGKMAFAKRVALGATLALFAAFIPVTLNALQSSVGLPVSASPQEMPRMVRVAPSGRDSATVTWETEVSALAAVRFSVAPFDLAKSIVVVADGGKAAMSHSATLPKLKNGTMYEFEILSADNWYDVGGVPVRFVFRGN